MTEDDIKQLLTSPAVADFFQKRLDDRRLLLSISELSRRVGASRKDISHAMDCWERSHGAFGLAFIRLSNDSDNAHRLTCMGAYDDWIRRKERDSAGRGVFSIREDRYSA